MLKRIGVIAATLAIGVTTAIVATTGTSADAGGNPPRTLAAADFSAAPVLQDTETSTVGSTSSVMWVGAPTTGVPAGTALRVVQGDQKITTPGTVLDGLDIRGNVYVEAADVVIRNTIIRGRPGGSSGGLVMATSPQGRNLLIEDTEISPTVPSTRILGVMGGQFTLRRVNIHHVVDPVHIYGDNVTIEDSWLHDSMYLVNDPARGGTPTHDDSVQIQKGINITIVNNFMTGAHNAVIQTTQDQGPIANLLIKGNYFDHGACTLNLADKGRGTMVNTVVEGNTIGMHSRFSRCAVKLPGESAVPVLRDNYFTDGTVATWNR